MTGEEENRPQQSEESASQGVNQEGDQNPETPINPEVQKIEEELDILEASPVGLERMLTIGAIENKQQLHELIEIQIGARQKLIRNLLSNLALNSQLLPEFQRLGKRFVELNADIQIKLNSLLKIVDEKNNKSPVSSTVDQDIDKDDEEAKPSLLNEEQNLNTSIEIGPSWPPKYVARLRESIYKNRDKLKAKFYPESGPILDRSFDFENASDVQELNDLKAELEELRQQDPNTKKSELDDIRIWKKETEKTLQFLERTSSNNVEIAVSRHTELEDLLQETNDFLQGYEALEIALYQEMAPLLHPEIRELVDYSSSPDLTSLKTSQEIFEAYRSFVFDNYGPQVNQRLQAILPLVRAFDEQEKEGFSKALTEKYINPAQKEIENWKTVAYNYWKDNIDTLYSELNPAQPDSLAAELNSLRDESIIYTLELDGLYETRDRISQKLKIAQQTLQAEATAGHIPSESQDNRYTETLKAFWSRAQTLIDRIDEVIKEQRRTTASTRTVITFLEGGFSPTAPQEWKEGRWRKEHPAEIAKVIWTYIQEVLLKAEARGDLAYMKTHILESKIDLPDTPTVLSLLKSFISLGKEFEHQTLSDGRNKGKVFEEIGDKMIVDSTQVERIYSFGFDVHSRESDANALVAYFTESGNQMTYIDHERNYNIGVEYEDHNGGISLAERMLWAQQAYFAMHDPIYHKQALVGEEGYQSLGPNDKKEIEYAINQKNPLTYFPEAVGSENERLLKRILVRKIAGADHPPFWMTIKRVSGETLHQWYLRRAEAMRKYLDEEYKKLRNQFDTRTSTGQANRKDEYLDPPDIALQGNGFIAEQLVHNLGEYSLEPCKAEGQSLLNNGRKERIATSKASVELPVLHPHKGPTAIFYVSRFWSIADYRSKLTGEESSEGATGPRETLRDFGSVMDTQYDYYFFIPPKKWKNRAHQVDITNPNNPKDFEYQGVSLKEAIVLSDGLGDTKEIPFAHALSYPNRGGTEGGLGWYEEIRLSINHWNRIIKSDGLGVSWAQLRKFEPGSGGVMVTFDPSTVTSKLFPFAREVTYMMQRDKGIKMYEWPNIDAWRRHLKLEANYVEQQKNGVVDPTQPAVVDGTPVTNDEWNKVIEYRKKPTFRHQLVDMVDPSDQAKVVRFAHLWDEVVKAPKSPENRDEFETAVFNNPENSAWDIYKKLLIGKIIIGSISVGDVENIGFKELQAISQILSKDVWDLTMNSVSNRILKFLTGRERMREYQGLGFMSREEVTAMLRRASVNVRWGSVITDLLESLAKIK